MVSKTRSRSVGNSAGIEDFALGVDDVCVRCFEGAEGIGRLEIGVFQFDKLIVRMKRSKFLEFGLVGLRARARGGGENDDRGGGVRVVDVGKLRRKAGDGGEHVQGEEHALVLAQRE